MIKVIAGRLNGTNKANYWLYNEKAKIGDYAVVENCNGFDLIEIVGLLETDEEHIDRIIGNRINKKVICVIEKKGIEKNNA